MMTSNMNIVGRTPVDDHSYRYQMPMISTKIEGHGGNTKTLISNIIDLGKALERDPAEIMKFFSCELGARTTFDAETDRAWVKGVHQPGLLQSRLRNYIEGFVLCKSRTCKKPDVVYCFRAKKEDVVKICRTCRYEGILPPGHKLTPFIISQEKKNLVPKGIPGKRGDSSAHNLSCFGSGRVATTESPSKESMATLKNAYAFPAGPFDGFEDVEGGCCGGTAETDEREETEKMVFDRCLSRFQQWWGTQETAPETGFDQDRFIAAVLEKLRVLQSAAGLHPRYRPALFLGAALAPDFFKRMQVQQWRKILARLFTSTPGVCDPLLQRQLIAAFEWLCGTHLPANAALFSGVLKQLFDEDLVEEDVFLEWHTAALRNEWSLDPSLVSDDVLVAMKRNAGTFIAWLQDEEEEGDEDEDEAGDD